MWNVRLNCLRANYAARRMGMDTVVHDGESKCELVHRLMGTSVARERGTGGLRMETIQYYRAMEAFCRQRAKMDGENDLFWLSEAEVLGKFATNTPRQTRHFDVAPLTSGLPR